MVRGVFIVFAAVLISKLIVDEFKNRSILVMFSYPLNRKNILSAKLILIFWMTFITMAISNIVVVIGFIGLNQIIHLTSVASLTTLDFFAEILPDDCSGGTRAVIFRDEKLFYSSNNYFLAIHS